ncbi:MAG: M50 family metallopeptidase [Nitriliruptoraceae bacterium]
MSSGVAITLFFVAILVAVLIHELGHLVAAKAFGMRADRYFVGFGPTLYARQIGETEYGVKLFPLGGFVTIRGMGDQDERRQPVYDVVAGELDQSPAGTFSSAFCDRLEDLLKERGASRQVRERIRRRIEAFAGNDDQADTTHAEVSRDRYLTEVLTTEIGTSARVGDLAWRVFRGDEQRFYQDRPPWQRAVAVVVGPATHLLVAFGLLFFAYLTFTLPTAEPSQTVGSIVDDSPAQTGGLQVGDTILRVGGTPADTFAATRELIRSQPNEPLAFDVQRDEEQLRLIITPNAVVDEATGETVGVAGFLPAPRERKLTFSESVITAARGSDLHPLGGVAPMVNASVRGIATIFSPSGLGSLVSTSVGAQDRDPDGAVSVIGVASLAGQTADSGPNGVFALLFLIAYVNVFLFIFNLLPLPPFDGGHLAVLSIEKVGTAVRRRRGRHGVFRVDPRVITSVAIPVFAVLLVVLVATVWLDLRNPLTFG